MSQHAFAEDACGTENVIRSYELRHQAIGELAEVIACVLYVPRACDCARRVGRLIIASSSQFCRERIGIFRDAFSAIRSQRRSNGLVMLEAAVDRRGW